MSSPVAAPSTQTPSAPTCTPAADIPTDVLAIASTPALTPNSPPIPSVSGPNRTSPRSTDRVLESNRQVARNISPGLLARMKFLNHGQDSVDSARAQPAQIGRISERKIRELDDFHRDRSVRISIERRGIAWGGTYSQVGTPLIPQLTGESVPALAMDHSPPPGFESDRSSFVSTSDRVLPSDSEAGELGEDTQKYRLPDLTKTKSLGQVNTDTQTRTEAAGSRAPTPPPKDTPPAREESVLDANDGIDVAAYFHQRQLSRAQSIYTLSRASFTNQIQQLTSIPLPPAASLSESISAIPTSTAAGRALHEAANQIKLWMAKATEVLDSLDAEDDVEWAAAAGREGLEEVDAAIQKFEGLVTVYIIAIEELQSRSDIKSLPHNDLQRLVSQMEEVVGSWQKIKLTLNGIKRQVEIAMEWEELWNTVLGEIGFEIENLSRLVFEMEERRHRAISDSVAESAQYFDIAELETIVEEAPRKHARIQNNRFSLPPQLSVMSPISPIPQIEQESSRLLALFAKLQPLRASLDFLPMRLSGFHLRASNMFPSACDELMRRKEVLEKQEKKLEADADALREELGEDKWVHSFRQAGSKAVAMHDSLMKSIQRLRQAIDDNDEERLGSRISTYKDKREHYPPAMKRVLSLIDIEMKNRSTVNGEILRIQQDVRHKVSDLEQESKEMDIVVEELTSNRKLRDSVSTVLSARTEHSLTSSTLGTPNSSPASSVILMGRRSGEYGTTTPAGKKPRQPSSSNSKASVPAGRRYSSLPVSTTSNVPRRSLTPSRLASIPSSVTPSRNTTSTPTSSVRSTTPASLNASVKPRWNASTNMRDTVVGHNHRPLSLTTSSPYHKGQAPPGQTLSSIPNQSGIPVRSPLGRASLLSPPPTGRPASTVPGQQSLSRRPLANTIQSPSTPARGKTPVHSTPGSSSHQHSGTPSSATRITLEEEGDSTAAEDSPIARRTRPASAMNSRRTSLLPTPKQRTTSGSTFAALTGNAVPMQRSGSRLGSVDEGRKSRIGLDPGRTSRVGGRKSSLGIAQSGGDEQRRLKN